MSDKAKDGIIISYTWWSYFEKAQKKKMKFRSVIILFFLLFLHIKNDDFKLPSE